jgi:tetratricopeptide (TPR) repeat protein
MRYSDDWARWATVASLWGERARYSGDYADYARAEDAYRVAFAIAPDGSGPLLGRARLSFSLHRLSAAEADLERFASHRLDTTQRAEVLLFRADLALQRGRAAEAEPLYAESIALHDSLGARYGQAQLAWWRGDHDGALRGLDACEAMVHGDNDPTTRMWLDLQRGLVELSRGRYEAALAHYRDADAHVRGHWLIREHIAEVTHLLGDSDGALAMYREIVLDTHNPEFMSAIASILAERGDVAGSARWVAWADAAFARQLAQFPEAAAGHALDHLLEHGDPAQALALAERNAELRPNGEALTKLAAAYRLSGRTREADAAIRRAAATGWEWADRYAEEALIARALGDEARAQQAEQRLRALDPSPEG